MTTKNKDLHTGKTYWRSLPFPRVPFSPITSNMQADIVIVGAGITGAMAAEELASAGFKVVLLDRRGPLQGATSATTALIQHEIDTPLTHLQKKIGKNDAMRAWRRSKLGLVSLQAKLSSLSIECSLRVSPSLYLAGDVLNAGEMASEHEARRLIGLHCSYLSRRDLKERYGVARSAALHSHGNFTVDPLRMAAGFLEHAIAQGAKIYAPAKAEHVEYSGSGVRVHTSEGPVVQADTLIYASGYEMPKQIHSRKLSIHSTYAITTRPQPDQLWPERAMIWEAADPYLYIRSTPEGRVICGGEDEGFENEEKRDALLTIKTRALEKKLKKLFPHLDTRSEFAWCGSFGQSNTGLPAIGAIPGMQNCYAILAFGGNGITYSRIAAELLRAELTGKKDPERDLFAF